MESGIDPLTAPRQLDNVVCFCPSKVTNARSFQMFFIKNYNELNIPLAEFCPRFEKAFYCLSLIFFQKFGGSTPLTEQSKSDLLIWAGFLLDPDKWFPICPRPTALPIQRLEFTSDATGAGTNCSGKIGCGNLGLNSRGEIFYAAWLY